MFCLTDVLKLLLLLKQHTCLLLKLSVLNAINVSYLLFFLKQRRRQLNDASQAHKYVYRHLASSIFTVFPVRFFRQFYVGC